MNSRSDQGQLVRVPVLVVDGGMSSSDRKLERSLSVSSRSDLGQWVRVPGLVIHLETF